MQSPNGTYFFKETVMAPEAETETGVQAAANEVMARVSPSARASVIVKVAKEIQIEWQNREKKYRDGIAAFIDSYEGDLEEENKRVSEPAANDSKIADEKYLVN